MSSLAELKKVSKERMKGCHPGLQEKVLHIIEDLYEQGLRFAVHTGLRTFDQQRALYAQGRKSIDEVNDLRRIAGYHRISSRENRKKVTSVTISWHNFGVAVDLVEDASTKKDIQWSWAKVRNYLRIGSVARKYNLNWGGSWKSFKDYPHLQLKMSISRRDAYRMYHRGGLKHVWSRV